MSLKKLIYRKIRSYFYTKLILCFEKKPRSVSKGIITHCDANRDAIVKLQQSKPCGYLENASRNAVGIILNNAK